MTPMTIANLPVNSRVASSQMHTTMLYHFDCTHIARTNQIALYWNPRLVQSWLLATQSRRDDYPKPTA
ncbi:MAG: hypothetical protein N2559_15615, partial [Anaerolineae bacterium]|nr:hypothetical protein [Anaerolineae bacterium]